MATDAIREALEVVLNVAKWERSRNRYGLWVGTTRLAYCGKEFKSHRWCWSIDIPPYTCGECDTATKAKKRGGG